MLNGTDLISQSGKRGKDGSDREKKKGKWVQPPSLVLNPFGRSENEKKSALIRQGKRGGGKSGRIRRPSSSAKYIDQ